MRPVRLSFLDYSGVTGTKFINYWKINLVYASVWWRVVTSRCAAWEKNNKLNYLEFHLREVPIWSL